MKIILNLNKSYNNYYWKDKEELKDYIKYMLGVLWNLQREIANGEEDRQNEEDRLYDILDFFEEFEIEEENIDFNEKIEQFRTGYLSMKELIKLLDTDLLECDIDDLKDIIKENERK
jgi:hypothetical protein